MSRWPTLIVLLGAAACGGQTQEPLLGVWQVTAHTHNSTGCAAEGPAVVEPPYVEFVMSAIEGQQVLELVDCTTPAACAASAGLRGRLFTDPVAGGRRSSVFVSFGDSALCTLAARRADAVIAADATLRVETRRFEAKDLTAVVCDDATAAGMLPALPCAELDVLTATAPLAAP